ncbi:septum site-determining protein MinC [Gilvimarinus sp. SDUM040013]|uniref:Probable septum site-determining protein MinC n=1 Tax=Gilvimarinus gilvus TaxID=3058038 RepID=A0ABU4RVB8_9GAMM|nr:septum site-determining protein MinC [Gilvimarinus sp. SDUM040013]MDO3387832.1 septum site-determining protein MinC [Gilvimarinus sp. SDUM040013]MDX6848797.1 septum site-determining protein MinC [Gilvimarinus sp. SDUM040013]
MADPCFHIKGTSVTSMVLDLYRYQRDEFAETLRQKIETAPLFFTGSPLFLNLASFTGGMDKTQMQSIVSECRSAGFQLYGFRGAEEHVAQMAKDAGLVHLPTPRPRTEQAPEAPASEPTPQPAANSNPTPTKVISKPVRSGQQVYAEGADLILLAPVSEGAEVIADGNIHVYSALRGRALAGVRDNSNARIFCQKLEAELVSIAGHFILNDSFSEAVWKKPAQVFLQDDSIEIAAL